MYASVSYVFKLVGANKTQKVKKKPWWKRRLEERFKQPNCDLGYVKMLLVKKKIKKKHKNRLERKCNIQRKKP